MTLLALTLTAVLWLIATMHAYWGLGGHWPATDKPSLARAVVGAPNIQRMPSAIACFVVAVLLGIMGVWPLVRTGLITAAMPHWVMMSAGIGMVAAFVGRGFAGYLPAWRRLTPEQPFARLDRMLYAPLCLALGLGITLLLLANGISIRNTVTQ